MKKELIIRGVQYLMASFFFDAPGLSRLKSFILGLLFSIGKNFEITHGSIFVSPHTTHKGFLKIADNVSIEHECYIDYSGGLVINENVWISEKVLIVTHNHRVKKRALKKEQEIVFSPLVIEEDAWLGASSLILEPVRRIGRGAVVGAGAVVTKDVDDWMIVAGNPARIIGQREV